MTPLGAWSFARVLLVSVGLFVLTTGVMVCWLIWKLWAGTQISDGGGVGIGVTFFVVNALVLAIPVLPPIFLIVLWLIIRSR